MKWFPNTVKGCYVRVNIGTGDTKSCYRIAEIVEVIESSKVYPLGKHDVINQINKVYDVITKHNRKIFENQKVKS